MPRFALVLVLLFCATDVHATEVLFRHRPQGPVRSVSVAGQFNEWNVAATPMQDADGDGVWEVRLDLAPGSHPYKFVEDGNVWITDETAEEFTGDGFGGQNSVLVLGDQARVAGVPLDEVEMAQELGPVVTFRFAPPRRANAVSVAGDFNDWNAAAHPLGDADGDGVWEVEIRMPAGLHSFQFVLDGDEWVGAPGAARHEDDGFGGRRGLFELRDEAVVIQGG